MTRKHVKLFESGDSPLCPFKIVCDEKTIKINVGITHVCIYGWLLLIYRPILWTLQPSGHKSMNIEFQTIHRKNFFVTFFSYKMLKPLNLRGI